LEAAGKGRGEEKKKGGEKRLLRAGRAHRALVGSSDEPRFRKGKEWGGKKRKKRKRQYCGARRLGVLPAVILYFSKRGKRRKKGEKKRKKEKRRKSKEGTLVSRPGAILALVEDIPFNSFLGGKEREGGEKKKKKGGKGERRKTLTLCRSDLLSAEEGKRKEKGRGCAASLALALSLATIVASGPDAEREEEEREKERPGDQGTVVSKRRGKGKKKGGGKKKVVVDSGDHWLFMGCCNLFLSRRGGGKGEKKKKGGGERGGRKNGRGAGQTRALSVWLRHPKRGEKKKKGTYATVRGGGHAMSPASVYFLRKEGERGEKREGRGMCHQRERVTLARRPLLPLYTCPKKGEKKEKKGEKEGGI